MPSESVLVQGTSIQVSTTAQTELNPVVAPTFETLDCLARDMQWQGGTAPDIDITTMCSTAKEFLLGLSDPGTFTLNGHWVQTHPAHVILRTADADKGLRLFLVTFADASEFRFLASVQQRSWSAAVDGVVTASYQFRLSGPVGETP